MRQVIRRFLKHLVAAKNASPSTIDTYRYDLNKFADYMAHRLGSRFLPGDVSRDHIRDYFAWLSDVGHQRPNGRAARARALAAIRSFFKYAHRAGLLRDNPTGDIALPKMRMGEIPALSQIECGRVLRAIDTNPSPFRKVRDRAIIVTFLPTGAMLPNRNSNLISSRGGSGAGQARCLSRVGIKESLGERLVFGQEIFQEIPGQDERNRSTRFATHICDVALEPRRKSQGYSDPHEPQESGYDGSIPTFAEPRAYKSCERFEVAGRLRSRRRSVQY